MNRKRTRQDPKMQAAGFNERYPVGAVVDFYSHPKDAPKRCHVRAPAEVLSGSVAVVWLEEKMGCVALDAVKPVQTESV